jgi:hypothetical protein
MKKLILISMLFMMGSLAKAETVTYDGDAADSFISRHFPDAEIPGPVEGAFQYINRHRQLRQGYAKCFVPAMGGRSDGFTSSCEVQY